eukprot:TRINITY_DN33584_c0_g1_i2.p1 TRINITY_DN33584_c0_g1~~TRINITY_DN33584_c0_g1_i2.p1  ORF type:complete len:773 (-),score=208.95 TRINITY_DN33584_c0_g1_i2:725-3043(-)
MPTDAPSTDKAQSAAGPAGGSAEKRSEKGATGATGPAKDDGPADTAQAGKAAPVATAQPAAAPAKGIDGVAGAAGRSTPGQEAKQSASPEAEVRASPSQKAAADSSAATSKKSVSIAASAELVSLKRQLAEEDSAEQGNAWHDQATITTIPTKGDSGKQADPGRAAKPGKATSSQQVGGKDAPEQKGDASQPEKTSEAQKASSSQQAGEKGVPGQKGDVAKTEKAGDAEKASSSQQSGEKGAPEQKGDAAKPEKVSDAKTAASSQQAEKDAPSQNDDVKTQTQKASEEQQLQQQQQEAGQKPAAVGDGKEGGSTPAQQSGATSDMKKADDGPAAAPASAPAKEAAVGVTVDADEKSTTGKASNVAATTAAGPEEASPAAESPRRKKGLVAAPKSKIPPIDQWRLGWLKNGKAPWKARNGHVAIALANNSVLIMGGYDGDRYLNDVWCLSAANAQVHHNLWTWRCLGAAPWSGRSGHVAVSLPGKYVVVLGGYDGAKMLADTWLYRYDLCDELAKTHASTKAAEAEDGSPERSKTKKKQPWSILGTAHWTPRANFAAVEFSDGAVLVTGGFDGKVQMRDVWTYIPGHEEDDYPKPGSGVWQQNFPPPWTPREGHAMTVLPHANEAVLLCGGYTLTAGARAGPQNDIWTYERVHDAWTCVVTNAPWAPRWGHHAAAFRDGRCFVFGGCGGNGGAAPPNDVWGMHPEEQRWTNLGVFPKGALAPVMAIADTTELKLSVFLCGKMDDADGAWCPVSKTRHRGCATFWLEVGQISYF